MIEVSESLKSLSYSKIFLSSLFLAMAISALTIFNLDLAVVNFLRAEFILFKSPSFRACFNSFSALLNSDKSSFSFFWKSLEFSNFILLFNFLFSNSSFFILDKYWF